MFGRAPSSQGRSRGFAIAAIILGFTLALVISIYERQRSLALLQPISMKYDTSASEEIKRLATEVRRLGVPVALSSGAETVAIAHGRRIYGESNVISAISDAANGTSDAMGEALYSSGRKAMCGCTPTGVAT